MSKKTVLVKNNIIALKEALSITDQDYNNSSLCSIHNLLMNDANNKNHSQIRKTQTFFNTHTIEGLPNYNPPPPEKLESLMYDLEDFINADNKTDELIKIALAHYQFEALHPFISGNGRLGRILIYFTLLNKKITSRLLFSISGYLYLYKVEYFDRIEAVQNFKHYNQWIKFFLTAVIYSTDEAYKEINNWLVLREENIEKINKLDKISRTTMKLYDFIEKFPIFSIKTLSEESGMAFNTVADTVKRLVEIGIVKKSNCFDRNRMFSYTGFIECFFHESGCL